ncbi:MAG: hypothetical protein A2202_07035 [Bdellovibrionales bacterium RIFOXYA1_FULL_36_14]|nr:MAG: hypothetical protein A2202_07035 [Bdellovibrionales bacterium RIFOXYA1_FULL_36_14]
MKKNNGYIALSMAVLVGAAVMGAVIYLASQGSMKSKQFVGEIQKDQMDGILKLYVTQTAAVFRAELYKGVNPANPSGYGYHKEVRPNDEPTIKPRPKPTVTPSSKSPGNVKPKIYPTSAFFTTPRALFQKAASLFASFSIFQAMASPALPITNNDFETSQTDFKCLANPDVNNPAHRYVEPNPPAGKTIVYTCKEIPPRTKGAVITAYFLEKNNVNQDMFATAFVSYQLPIGKVITSKGNYIKRTNKLVPEIDSLSPLSFDNTLNPDLNNIYLHDLIQTTNSANFDDKQFLKIYLNDKTVIQIGPDSEFYFKKFLFQKVNERSTLYKLIKGSIQVLYANKNNNEEMIIETPSVALGVRGTEYKLQVRETNRAYHVTMDVISGQVAVFEHGNTLIKTVLPGETFNHYQAKNQTTGSHANGSVRTFEKNNFYNVLPIPTPATTTPGSYASENDIILEKISTINELLHIRKENLLLYGYFHNASRDPSQIYFQHIKAAGGWGEYYKLIRPSLINEPLFIPNKAQYGGMSFPIGQSPVPKSFEIAMMSPNGFDSIYDINLNFALVYDQNYSNNSFLLIYPAESLDSLANRFVPGPYTEIQNYIMLSPLPGLKLNNGDIVGCGTGSSPCDDIGSLRAQIPSDYEASRLIIFNGDQRTITPWPPKPKPVATAAPAPVDNKGSSKDTGSSSKKSSKKSTPKATPTPIPTVCRELHHKKCAPGGYEGDCFEPECPSCRGISHEVSNVVIGTVCQ